MTTSKIHEICPPTPALHGKLRDGAVGHSGPWPEGPTARFMAVRAAPGATPFTGHLGMLRHGNPVPERQRRYDFVFKHL